MLVATAIGPAHAAAPSRQQPFTGSWSVTDHCVSGWCAGNQYTGTWSMTENSSGAISGTDSAGNVIAGSASGTSATFSFSPAPGSANRYAFTEHGATFKCVGLTPTFTGTFTDNEGGSGTTIASTSGTQCRATDTLAIKLEPTSAQATGHAWADATITDTNAKNEPVVGVSLHITPTSIYGEGYPTAIICDETGIVDPTSLGDGKWLGAGFDRTTDSAGQVKFRVFFGTAAGEWILDAKENEEGSERVFSGINVGAGGASTQLPPELVSLLEAAGNQFSLADYAASPQRDMLRWLAGVGPAALAGVAWAPITAIDAAGAKSSGVVLYADSAAVRSRLMSYLAGSGPAPSDLEAVVIDMKTVSRLLFGTYATGSTPNAPIPFRLPSLEEWSNGTSIEIQSPETRYGGKGTRIPIPARGPAHFGLEGSAGNEALLFGNGPYPGVNENDPAQAELNKCIPFGASTTIMPHSPIAIEAVGAGGSAGINHKGEPFDKIPGAIVVFKGSKMTSLQLVPGSYRLKIRSTGNGPAAIVIASSGRSSARTSVFSFAVHSGQSGSLSVNAGSTTTSMSWGGRVVRANPGVGLLIAGLPHSVRHGRSTRLSLRLRNQFGRPAGGVILTARGAALDRSLKATSSAGGTISFPFKAKRAGRIHVRLSAPGYATRTLTLPVH